MKNLFLFAIVLFAIFCNINAQDDADLNSDTKWFMTLYEKISTIVSPGAASPGAARGASDPITELFLMEMPGFAIAREDLDTASWAAGGFNDRSPSYVFASLVDRLPKYTDVVFTDSGATISGQWRTLMRQYLVPVAESEAQKEKVQQARDYLNNGTLEEDFIEALDRYSASFTSSVNQRKDCLDENALSPEICNQLQVLTELQLKSDWFYMETARRDLIGAQATVLALQLQDLKVLYAEALQRFERQLRVDVGGVSFGTEFYQTFANPSNFHEWWPLSASNYDFTVSGETTQFYDWASLGRGTFSTKYDMNETTGPDADTDLVNTDIVTNEGGTICFADTVGQCGSASGQLVDDGFFYTPASGFSGVDYFTFTMEIETNRTTEETVSFAVNSNGASGAADAAFSRIASSAAESSSTQTASTRSLSVSVSIRVNYGLFSGSGSTNVDTSSSSSSSSSQSSRTDTVFEIAKVIIIRPWMDTSILHYKPVAIRGMNPGGWSIGTGRPPKAGDPVQSFPLLPTAIIVARNIEMTSSSWGSLSTSMESATSSDSKVRMRYGPFVSGSARVKTSSTDSYAHQESSFESNSLTIPGPQIIGWVATPMPYFPTADYQTLEKQNFGEVITTFTVNS